MKILTKKTLSVVSLTAVVLSSFAFISLATPGSAQTTTLVGNDTTARSLIDSASNFTIIDTNHPATTSDQITSFGYNASNMNPFSFVLVNASNVVEYVSPLITPTALGVGTFAPSSPVPIQAGWNLGLYFGSTGTVPFDGTGNTASFTASGSGGPTVGSTLAIAGTASRTYSIMGSGGSTTTTPVLTSVTVIPTSATVGVGGTQQLTASPMDQNSTAFSGAALTYNSGNTAAATVSSTGLVTGVAQGSATITVTATSGSVSVSTTSAITVTGNGGEIRNPAQSLRITIILNMIRRLLSEIGINETFTAPNGMTF